MAVLTAPETSEFKFKLFLLVFYFLEFLENKLMLSSKHYASYTPSSYVCSFYVPTLFVLPRGRLRAPFPSFVRRVARGRQLR